MLPPFLVRIRTSRALAAALLVSSGITLAQAPETGAAPSQSKMGARIMQLQKIDTVVGTGAEAIAGKIAVVHYTGWLYDPASSDKKGRRFDSSLDRRAPFSFPIGGGRVIRGWDEGVVGMHVGGRRTLVIPPEMAYGSRGAGGGVVPPDATLLFEVELLDVKNG